MVKLSCTEIDLIFAALSDPVPAGPYSHNTGCSWLVIEPTFWLTRKASIYCFQLPLWENFNKGWDWGILLRSLLFKPLTRIKDGGVTALITVWNKLKWAFFGGCWLYRRLWLFRELYPHIEVVNVWFYLTFLRNGASRRCDRLKLACLLSCSGDQTVCFTKSPFFFASSQFGIQLCN